MSADLGRTHPAEEHWKLASFCNSQGSDSRLLLAFWGSETRWIPGPYDEKHQNAQGCTGLARRGSKYYALMQLSGAAIGKTGLMVLDHNCQWLRSQPLELVQDGHSLAVHRGRLYAISTGNNSIYQLVLDTQGLEVVAEEHSWSYSSETDTNIVHLNSLCFAGDELFVTMFGKGGRESPNGLVYNVSRQRVVHSGSFQPHSLTLVKDQLALLGSAESAMYVLSPDGDLLKKVKLSGYLRGLCHSGGRFYVGRSADRILSRSTGGSREPTVADRPAAILVLDEGLNVLRTINCEEYGQEIYDLYATPLEHLTAASPGTASHSNHVERVENQ